MPITVNRVYNTQLGTAKSFGYNGQLDYEQINIQKSSGLATGWQGKKSGGLTYYVADTAQHLVTVSLSPTEQYFFMPQVVFRQSDGSYAPTIVSSSVPDCYNFFKVHLAFIPIGQGQLTVAAPSPSRVGMDDGLSGWTVPLTIVHYESDDGFPTSDYEPAFSDFTFTAPDGTKYNFDGSGNVSQHTDRNGNYLQYSYNGIVHSSGEQVIFDRDPTSGNITAIYDPNSQDGFGNITGPATVTYAYDGLGNLTNMNRLVNFGTGTYLTNNYGFTNGSFPNNVTATTDPRGVVAAGYFYDSGGRLTRQYDGLGNYTSYIYDTANHRQIVTDRLNNSTVQNFTPAGELASVQDPANDVTSYTYDSQGRKIAETNPLNESTTFAYDNNNNLIATTNELGSATTATYDSYGQPLVSVDVRGYGTTNAYDANDNLLFITNALNVVTAYGYDSQGDQIAITNALNLPEESIILNAYDQFGNLTNTATLNAQGVMLNSIGYTYDADGNKLTETTTRTTSGGPQTVLNQRVYDAANRVTATIDGLGHTNFTVFNGIGKESQSMDALGRPTYYYYDGDAYLTNTTFPDGLSESLGYDAESHKIRSTDRAGNTTAYTYDAVGRVIKTTYADGIATGNNFDGAGRLTRTTITPPVSGFAPPNAALTISFFSYDVAGRRITATNALNQGTHFAYDAAGNQTNLVDALGHSTGYVFDPLNRQVQTVYPDNTSQIS
jgi:YD repeat-containing protein